MHIHSDLVILHISTAQGTYTSAAVLAFSILELCKLQTHPQHSFALHAHPQLSWHSPYFNWAGRMHILSSLVILRALHANPVHVHAQGACTSLTVFSFCAPCMHILICLGILHNWTAQGACTSSADLPFSVTAHAHFQQSWHYACLACKPFRCIGILELHRAHAHPQQYWHSARLACTL